MLLCCCRLALSVLLFAVCVPMSQIASPATDNPFPSSTLILWTGRFWRASVGVKFTTETNDAQIVIEVYTVFSVNSEWLAFQYFACLVFWTYVSDLQSRWYCLFKGFFWFLLCHTKQIQSRCITWSLNLIFLAFLPQPPNCHSYVGISSQIMCPNWDFDGFPESVHTHTDVVTYIRPWLLLHGFLDLLLRYCPSINCEQLALLLNRPKNSILIDCCVVRLLI